MVIIERIEANSEYKHPCFEFVNFAGWDGFDMIAKLLVTEHGFKVDA